MTIYVIRFTDITIIKFHEKTKTSSIYVIRSTDITIIKFHEKTKTSRLLCTPVNAENKTRHTNVAQIK